MTERLLMIDSAKTVLETIKVTARLSRTEQEAIDFAIDELGKKEDLLETLKDIKDNVYQQGRADERQRILGMVDFKQSDNPIRREVDFSISFDSMLNPEEVVRIMSEQIRKQLKEQIKNTIVSLEILRKTRFFIPNNKELDTAIRSLQAWEEVLNKLHEWKNNAENEHEQKIVYAYFSAIDIIKQKLAEIEEE